MCRIWPISLPLPFGDLQGALGSIFLAPCHIPGQLLPAQPRLPAGERATEMEEEKE